MPIKYLFGDNATAVLTAPGNPSTDTTLAIGSDTGLPAPNAAAGEIVAAVLTDADETTFTHFTYTGNALGVLSGVVYLKGPSVTWGAGTKVQQRDPASVWAAFSQVASDETVPGVKTFPDGSIVAQSMRMASRTSPPVAPGSGEAKIVVRSPGGLSTEPPHMAVIVDQYGVEKALAPSLANGRRMEWQATGITAVTAGLDRFGFQPGTNGAMNGNVTVVPYAAGSTSERGLFTGTRYATATTANAAAGMNPVGNANAHGIRRTGRLGRGGGYFYHRISFDPAYGGALGMRMAIGIGQNNFSPAATNFSTQAASGIYFGGEDTDTGPVIVTRSTTSGAGGMTKTPLAVVRTWADLAGKVLEVWGKIAPGDGTNPGSCLVHVEEWNNTDFTSVVLFHGLLAGNLPTSGASALMTPCAIVVNGALGVAISIDIDRGTAWERP